MITTFDNNPGMGHKSSRDEPDTHATDVRGVKPTIVDLGEITDNVSRLGKALLKMKTCLESEERHHGVTLLYDRYISDRARNVVLEMAMRANWQVRLTTGCPKWVWVLLTWNRVFHCLPNSAWADGNVAEAAGQLSKMVESPYSVGGTQQSKSTQPRSQLTWDTLYLLNLSHIC